MIARSFNEWNTRINHKHKEMASLKLSQAQRQRLDLWIETEFVYSTLKFEGNDATRADVACLVASKTSAAAQSGSNADAAGLLEALRIIESLAKAKNQTAALTPAVLLDVQRHISGKENFRATDASASRLVKPPPADRLSASIEGACRWFMADSFSELNPIEQASIVYLRLIELQPFEEANERGSLVAASLYTVRHDLPPLILKLERAAAYRAALEEGFQMNTRALVEFFAEAINDALGEMLALAR